jgi:adenine-specific DNA-methyltransferase
VRVPRGDARAACLAAPPGSLLYLDPPFTARSYARAYHVLDALADPGREPSPAGVSGAPAARSPCSPWNRPEEALAELRAILEGTPATRVALSYSTDGLMRAPDIEQAFRNSGWGCKKVQICSRRYASRKRGLEDAAKGRSEFKELLFLGKKKERPGGVGNY